MDIKPLLDEMMTIAIKLENQLDSADYQVQEQQHCINIIRGSISHLQRLYPTLLRLLQDLSPYEAVRRMSTEWKTPFVSIMGYSQLIQAGQLCGEFTDEQLNHIEQLANIAEQVKEWSDIPQT